MTVPIPGLKNLITLLKTLLFSFNAVIYSSHNSLYGMPNASAMSFCVLFDFTLRCQTRLTHVLDFPIFLAIAVMSGFTRSVFLTRFINILFIMYLSIPKCIVFVKRKNTNVN